MDPEPSARLEAQVAELTSRVWRLEQALSHHGIVVEGEAVHRAEVKPVAAETTVASPVLPKPIVAQPAPAFAQTLTQKVALGAAPPMAARPIFQSVAEPHRSDGPSLESRIGSQWLNRIGILAVLIGMAWFLKYAIDNHWIGPLGRVLIGLVAGAALIVWSERFRNSGYAAFSYSLKALGSGILYLSLWAAFSYFHLVPGGVAFTAMIAVTAFNGYMAWVQDSELLALYAIAGGLSTPLLVSTGENHEIALLSYLLLLDIAVLILVALRPWSRLLFSAYAGTVLFVAGWWAEFYTAAQAWRTAFFVGCFFLIFALAPRLVRIDLEGEGHMRKWDALAAVLLPMANAALGFLAFYGLFDSSGAEWAGPWLAVAFAAFYLLMLRLPVGGALRESPGVLGDLHLTAVVVFLTIAIPLKAHGRWLTVGWLVEGAALLWMSMRLSSALLRVLSLLCLVLGLSALIVANPPAAVTPIFNHRFTTYCIGIAVFAFVAWLAKSQMERKAEGSELWATLAAVAALIINALILIAVCLEIHSYWWYVKWRGDWTLMHDYHMYAQFTYSAFLMLFGVALLAIGFWRNSAFVRWQALVLLAVSIGKVFLVDVSELSQGYRIVSFLGLGALLLAVSFVYQRDLLGLRKHESAANHESSSEPDPERRSS